MVGSLGFLGLCEEFTVPHDRVKHVKSEFKVPVPDEANGAVDVCCRILASDFYDISTVAGRQSPYLASIFPTHVSGTLEVDATSVCIIPESKL